MNRVGFLYNHDAPHQVAHIAGIMGELARSGAVQVHALCGTSAAEAVARRLAGDAAQRIKWERLTLGPLARAAAPALDRVFPFSRLLHLRENLARFAALDLLVSTERTCLRIKSALGPRAPRLVYVPHGSGDRNVAHHPDLARFDLHLVSGQKLVDVGRAAGLFSDNVAIIGYPKFDTVDLAARPRLFANDAPVVLYNPHFDPHLSSVYRFRHAVLALFRARPDYNLIFAPHVMYGRKRLHYSLEYRRFGWRSPLPDWVGTCPNILVDLGSPRSIDMSYALAADIYLGDVSSQVYEFLVRPRACFFLDSHRGPGWRDDPDYQFWRNGPVLPSVDALAAQLPRWRQVADDHVPVQRELFAYTIDQQPVPASVRGAQALLRYLETL